MAEPIAFGAVAAVVLGSAFALVVGRNLVHCVLWLAAMLLATAVLFVLLGASFLGAIQVMLYAGGVVTLMLFAVMLTRRSGGVAVENEVAPERRLPAAILSLLLFAGMAWAIHATPELPRVPAPPVTTEAIAMAFLTDYVLAFEVLSVLLLAATIGAIVIARKHDHGAEEASRQGRPGRPAVRPKIAARAGGAE
jgi:NADH-quinone oxidoreductase subunit J